MSESTRSRIPRAGLLALLSVLALAGTLLVAAAGETADGGDPPRTAWEEHLERNPGAADDDSLGPLERKILDALTPEQAAAFFDGTPPEQIVLDGGQTLAAFLARTMAAGPGLVYVPVDQCRLFATAFQTAPVTGPLAADEVREYVARGTGAVFADQGGTAGGCGIPDEAVAVVLHFRLVAQLVQGGSGSFKVWPADDPEPSTRVIDYEPVVDPPREPRFRFNGAALVELCPLGACAGGELKVKAAGLGTHARGDVAGFFRAVEMADVMAAGDADTLDGLDSTDLALASHTHDGGDITSGTVGEPFIDPQIARDGEVVDLLKAGDGPGSGVDADLLDGLEAAAFRPRPANVILVDAAGGGDFTTISAALASIAGESTTNRFLVKVGVGTYTEQVLMKPFVDIEGKGKKATVISAASVAGPQGTVECADDAELRHLTVESTGGAEKAIAIRCAGASPMLTHVKAVATGATGGTAPENIGILNDGAGAMPMLTGVHADANPSPGLAVVNQGGAMPTIRDSDLDGADSAIENRDTATAKIANTALAGGANFQAPATQSSYMCVRAYVSGTLQQLSAECNPNTPPTATDDAYATLGNTLLEVTLDHAGAASLANTTATQPSVIGETTTPKTFRSVFENDSDAETADKNLLTAAVVGGTVSAGAVVNMFADGTFEYTPPVGFTGADTFDYTVTDPGGLMDTGTVTVTVSSLIWYVDADNVGTADGRSTTPYSSLAPIDALGADDGLDGTGDTIFVFDETTVTSTGDGILLEDSQILQGNGIALDPAGFEYAGGGDLVAAGTAPTLGNAAGDVVELASGNTVRGLDIAATAGLAITGTGVAGATIDEVATSSSGSGNGVLFDGVTGTIAMTDLDINSSNNWGIAIQDSSATFTFDAASSITNPTGVAFGVTNGAPNVTYSGTISNSSIQTIGVSTTTGGTVLFDGASINGTRILLTSVGGDVTVDAGATTLANSFMSGIEITSASTGTFRFDDVTITNPTDEGVEIAGGGGDAFTGTADFNNVDVTGGTGSPVVSISGVGPGAGGVDFDAASAISSTDRGIEITSNSGGTITFNGPATLNTGVMPAVNATSNAGASINFFGNLDLDTTTGTGFNVTGGGTVQATSAGNTVDTTGTAPGNGIGVNIGAAIGGLGVTFNSVNVGSSGKANSGILLSNTGSAGTFSVTGGTIQNTTSRGFDAANADGTVTIGAGIQNDGGNSVEITGSEGDFTFTGLVDEDAAGINISSNNTGTPTFTFQGGVTINTVLGNTGLRAFSGGTLAVCADTNCNGTGAALNNTVDTTAGTGTAVSIDMVTIGAPGVTFRSIAVNPGGAATTGIVLDTTGAGPFTVTGDGTTATFGGNGSGGTIQNIGDADAIRLENTDGAVTFQNMIIQDIADSGDGTDGINTRSQRDGIHGQMVDGGLVLKNVTMRRFSDNAILGSSTVDGTGFTVWDGLEIRDSLIENSNRYHLDQGVGGDPSDDKADDDNEGLVRILGIKGTVTVVDSTLRRGAEMLDLFTDTSGTLDMTVQGCTFTQSVKEFLCMPPGTVNVGKNCIDVEVRGSNAPLIKIGDPAEASSALGNTFTDCGTASVRLLQNAAGTGAVKAVVSQNDFIILDHLTGPPTCGGGSLQFNHPQGGVSLNTGGNSSFEGIVSNNLFDQVMHASGFVGQLALISDGSGADEFIVRGNEFKLPWDGAVEIIVDGPSANAQIHFDTNTYTDGTVGSAADDVGFVTPSPFNPYLLNVRNGGSLDITLEDEILHQHDDVSSAFANSFDASINASGGTLDLGIFGNTECTLPSGAACTSASPDGYNLERNGGTFNLYAKDGCGGGPSAQAILGANDNSGGSNSDTTKPPVVATTGTINCTATAPTLPSITIP